MINFLIGCIAILICAYPFSYLIGKGWHKSYLDQIEEKDYGKEK